VKLIRTLLLGAVACSLNLGAQAAEPIKIGFMTAYSGPFADMGRLIDAGAKAYIKAHGDTVAGRKIELLPRDTTGPAPEVGKRLAQELVVRDNVDFIVVGGFTPETLTAGSIASAAKKPLLVANASSTGITDKIPYGVRYAFSFRQITKPLGAWAAKNGYKKMMTLVADYGPGIDCENAFKEAFTAGGGTIVESVRTPLKSPEFGPFIQKVKDAKPDALFVWVPQGDQALGVVKTYYERGLDAAGIKLVILGDDIDEPVFNALGDKVKGLVTSLHYSTAHPTAENKKFLKAFAEVTGNAIQPNFMAVGGYDSMAAIYEAIRRQNGDVSDGAKTLEILSNLQFESPRGKIVIDPKTRDITQAVYIRRVEPHNGRLENVEFETIADVKP
jgi:branched-chain amino acid transport system substrate-binding protein